MPPVKVIIQRFNRGFKARRLAAQITTAAEHGIAVLDAEVARIAHAAVKDVQNAIREERFDHDPLDPKYAASKKRNGLDPRTLMATREYVESIRAERTGPMMYRVGVPETKKHSSSGIPMGKLSRILEHGTMDGSIPARPHMRPTAVRAGYYLRLAVDDFNRRQRRAARGARNGSR